MKPFQALFFYFLFTTSAHAYVGPGVGIGAIASILGVAAAVLLGFVGILYYPIKRALKKKQKKNPTRK